MSLLFLLTGMENADRISSGIGAAAGAIGLVVGGISAHRARAADREQKSDAPAITVKAEASGSARVYQVGEGSMQIEDH
jgi:hypothetical protein